VTIPEGWSLTKYSDGLWVVNGPGTGLENSGLYAIYGYTNVTLNLYDFHDAAGVPILYSYINNNGLTYVAEVGNSSPGSGFRSGATPTMDISFTRYGTVGTATSLVKGCHGFVLLYVGWGSLENVGAKRTLDESFYNSLP